MAIVSSIDPINIEDEQTILTIKIIGKPSHDCDVQNFIKGNYSSTTCVNAYEWYQDVFNYIKNGVIPIIFYHNAIIRFKKLAAKYVINGDLLYRRSFDSIILRCLMQNEIYMALHQAHDGICGGHFNANFFISKIT